MFVKKIVFDYPVVAGQESAHRVCINPRAFRISAWKPFAPEIRDLEMQLVRVLQVQIDFVAQLGLNRNRHRQADPDAGSGHLCGVVDHFQIGKPAPNVRKDSLCNSKSCLGARRLFRLCVRHHGVFSSMPW
jgi:hypothetical protein